MTPYIYAGLGYIKSKHKQVTITKEITNIVCNAYNVKFDKVDNSSRKSEFVEVRRAIMFWHKEASSATFEKIGGIFKRKFDHSTVMHSVTAYKNILTYEKSLQIIHEKIKSEIERKVL